jgi:predicted  nucleic acid-binding Zn-ribbon protein
VIAIEIQLLIDRLEALLIESRQVPFTSSVMIDRDRCFDLINQMRISIPEEIKKAKRVQQERERVIAQANEEAERITALAREQASKLVTGHEIVSQAESRIDAVMDRAKREAESVRSGADEYAMSVLSELEKHLLDYLTTVRNGMATLNANTGEESATE